MATLFERARDGDAPAMAEVQRCALAFARRVCSFGMRTDSAFDWEDVAQEAMRKLLHSGPQQYRGSGSEQSYIYTVVKCTVIQMARSSERRRKREEIAVAQASTTTPNPSRRLDLQMILGGLEPECRALIQRILFRDEAYSTIARELKLTESSVRSRLHRCLNRARAIATGESPKP